jgi:hypothetical protein
MFIINKRRNINGKSTLLWSRNRTWNQPEAADKITAAVNLPLFLLEGVAILAEVFTLLIVLMK